ncbi:MAG: ferrous iron transporter B [Blastocatellia bacterium]|nr:ferrous iron transporter B [Blastocatellia bacterium]
MENQSSPRGRITLVGNPNVGKSVIFGYLTGRYTIVSNYPGTTVEVARGEMRFGGRDFEVVDTPGTNSLDPQSEDERVTRDILLSEPPDILIQVADVKNLRRTLLLTSQLAELGRPMILVLNLMDEARQRGITVDSAAIAEIFGIPVVETVAPYGEGLNDLSKALGRAAVPNDPLADQLRMSVSRAADVAALAASGATAMRVHQSATLVGVSGLGDAVDLEHRRSQWVDESVETLKTIRERTVFDASDTMSTRILFGLLAVGLGLLVHTEVGSLFGWTTLYSLAQTAVQAIGPPVSEALTGVLAPLATLIVGTANDEGVFEFGLLHAVAHFLSVLAPVVVPFFLLIRRSRRFAENFGIWSRSPIFGAPILLTVLVLVYEFVGFIGAQTLVGTLEEGIFNQYINPGLRALIPLGFFHDLIVGNPADNYRNDYGLVSVGVTYAVAIVLPVVGTFFIAFGLLEDSGYLPRLAILGDRIFRLMGLNGKAILPMVLGLGCDTMATMTTRILATPKERLIATLLLALGVPCSAQLGVILGISAGISPVATLIVLGVVLSQMLLVGYLSAKLIRGEPSPFLFEIPPIRVPVVRNVAIKTGFRIKWFLREAVPLFILGTLILFLLDRIQVPFVAGAMSGIEAIEIVFRPVVTGILHMPAETAKVFILGFLRRDYGAAGLFDMAKDNILTVQQLITSMIVMTLFVPCIANFFVMIKEQGAKKAFAILGFITPFAIAVGAVVSYVLRMFHLFE